jgi:hypothetical protein
VLRPEKSKQNKFGDSEAQLSEDDAPSSPVIESEKVIAL